MLREKTAQRSKLAAKSQVRKAKVSEAVINENASLLAKEVLRILWLAASVYLVLALATYSAEDPSWSTWSSKTIFHNWMGRVGSIVSDLCIQVFGVGSITAVLLMFLLSAQISQAAMNSAERTRRLLFAASWLVAFSTLCQIALPKDWAPWNLKHSGGVIGFGMQQALVFLTGTKGSLLVAWVLVLVFSVLFFEKEIVSPAWKALKRMYASIAALFTGATNKYNAAVANVFEAWNARRAKALEAAAAEPTIGVADAFARPVVHPQSESLPSIHGAPLSAAPILATAQTVAVPTIASESREPRAGNPDSRISDPGSQIGASAQASGSGVQAPVTGTLATATDAGDGLTVGIEAARDEEIHKLAVSKVPKAIKESTAKSRKKTDAFHLPSLQLLSGRRDNQSKSVDRSWYVEKSQVLVQKLKDFGVDGEVVHISPGPVITVFEFKPASGVKIKEIANLSDDLTLALSVLSVRIVAPIPGKPVVGIEIPSPHRQTVYFKDMLEETPFFNDEMKIPVVLGRLASGEPVVTGLASMPHLLVAGSTGTGKSVFINSLICSLLYRYTPEQLKLILVDPKMVELAAYEGIPHLLLPVVVDSRKAALALRWAVDEMERRYTLMHQFGVRHVDAYNEKRSRELEQFKPEELAEMTNEERGMMPYIVVVIDEYADLMAVVPKDVELSIARLAQKARASGIHLVLATQRPSTDVVTGTIKANFPSRLSFRVASSIDSKTILDRPGAERLLGNGDMLFHSAGFTTLKRIQGAFLTDADMEAVVDSLKAQGEPEYDERLLQASIEGEGEEGQMELGDASLYDQAVRLVTEKGEASISLIQRHLKIGYNRAASLMEEMEKEGVVGGASGTSKRRQVLVNSL